MVILTIHDLDGSGLAFDLHHVLRALGSSAMAATWSVMSPKSSDFDATGAGGQILHALAEVSARISGESLLAIADDTAQVNWGDFEGVLPDDTNRAWLTIRACDSSFYEVETWDDSAVMDIQAHFNDVRIRIA